MLVADLLDRHDRLETVVATSHMSVGVVRHTHVPRGGFWRAQTPIAVRFSERRPTDDPPDEAYAPRSMSLEASVGGSAPRSVNVDAPHEHVRPWPAYGLEERSQRTRLQSGAHAPDAPGPAVFQGLAIYLAFLLSFIVRVARSIVVIACGCSAAVPSSNPVDDILRSFVPSFLRSCVPAFLVSSFPRFTC